MELGELRSRWQALLPTSDCQSSAASAAFEELVRAYSLPERYYHSLHHISALLNLVDEQAASFVDRSTVELAIFYHDAVYDSRRRDNEDQSARLADVRLGALGIPKPQLRRISALIAATNHGVAALDLADGDLMRFLDLDLSVLAAPRSDYDRYAAAIRAEYAIYPDADYRIGRARVLRSFLERRRLFHCDDLHARWDGAARDNMRAELDALGTAQTSP